jgi:ACS family hexuronate transporter-like MFS transporter
VIRPGDFAVNQKSEITPRAANLGDAELPLATPSSPHATWISRLIALIVVVITINLCWQYFRAWMPGMLREQYGYSKEDVQYFSIAYYITTDVGCLSIGFLVKWLADRGLTVHNSRMLAFFGCCLLTTLAIPASMIPASPLLFGILLLVGFGSLGQFPVYYALSQELSTRYMGRVTGLLSFMTWTATGFVQPWIGSYIDQTHTYTATTLISGAVPMLGFFALLCLWRPASDKPASVQASAGLV